MMQKLSEAQVKGILQQPNGSEKLFAQADAAFDAAYSLFENGDSQALSFLCRCAKRTSFVEEIEARLFLSRDALASALASSNPKMRKNAARLMGALENPHDAPALIKALNDEKARMVIPSLILALGAIGTDESKAALAAYNLMPPANDGEQRHYREESEALTAARARFFTLDKHAFTALSKSYEIELRTPDRLSAGLEYELRRTGIAAKQSFSNAVVVNTDDIAALQACRSFNEMLFIVGKSMSPDPKALALRCVPFLREMLLKQHDGKPPFGYRIELRVQDADRGTFSRNLASVMDSCGGEGLLVNSPGNYEIELRVEIRPSGADMFIKLYTIEDNRFAYRIGALPASMHPSTASAILCYARDYLSEGARVLDPCCGSGTFLIERGLFTPCASLTGVDIAHRAIAVARGNAAAANSIAKFIANDCLRLSAERPYDELIANLPFGNRVGTHKENEHLYAAMLDKLPQWLVPGGVALLYTMEFTLLKRLIRERKNLKLITETRTDAGGLMPGIFLIRVN